MILHLIPYGELNDFIKKSSSIIPFNLTQQSSVKDIIESRGIPHTEIAKITANKDEVGFDHIIDSDAVIEVYPFNSGQYSDKLPNPLTLSKYYFIVDCNMAKAVKYLRMLGFSVYYENHIKDEKIVKIASEKELIVLTRDKDLLKHALIKYGRFIRAIKVEQQITEIVNFFNLKDKIKPFYRCLVCDSKLIAIEKNRILSRIPKSVGLKFDKFKICKKCDKVYWEGSHYKKMYGFIYNI